MYGTPYIHTPTGLVERGVRTIKNYMLANMSEGKSLGKALDNALHVMRMKKHSVLKKSPFEMHYGRKPRSEVNNLLGLDPNLNITQIDNIISEKPDTIPIYTFNGDGGSTDQLIMRSQKKQKKLVSERFPFYFLEKKHSKGKFESAYSNKTTKSGSGNKAYHNHGEW